MTLDGNSVENLNFDAYQVHTEDLKIETYAKMKFTPFLNSGATDTMIVEPNSATHYIPVLLGLAERNLDPSRMADLKLARHGNEAARPKWICFMVRYALSFLLKI
eukprot:GHVP01017292.1.p1 GENE.GHVP01017292.1~~GHVP01017292.1.p1  ORF type:complete len:105 (-),score=11.46 GHVP01017292.1:248-562(-)